MTTVKSIMQANMADDLEQQRRVLAMSSHKEYRSYFSENTDDMVAMPYIPRRTLGSSPDQP